MERALYNDVNSGTSLSSTLYCYRNPLESPGGKIGSPWHDTTCRRPNLEWVPASFPGHVHSTSPEDLYVHQDQDSQPDWRLENGLGLSRLRRDPEDRVPVVRAGGDYDSARACR